ncbi:MAG: diguanylate cyclase [Deltaproteobacteria bacterium]|nr:MAG: diguanylate cyclase [Deltaproteobacteria bacterium]
MGVRRILIVDDDRSMLSAVADMVRDQGHEPHTATSWTDALRLYRQVRPDCVLLDVMMPTIDGFKMAQLLKREEEGGFVPIILITGLGDVESKRRGMASGADDFLTKPVNAVELEIRLASMLRIKDLADQLQRANDQLAELAATDGLTQLRNRRVLYEHLEREFARARRYKHPLAVFMLDVDHFKQVNDVHGHAVGDDVLRVVARVITTQTRETDIAGRYGGEEFVVLAPDTPTAAARVLGERIRAAVHAETEAADGVPAVTVSVGIATTESVQPAQFEDLLHLADEALYRAKKRGRNRVELAGR